MAQHIANENKDCRLDSSFYIYNGLVAAASWVVTYLGLPVEPAIILFVLMVIDFPMGIAASWANDEEITSKRMTRGVIEKMLTMMIPLVVGLTAKGAGQDWGLAVIAGTYILVLAEGYSILSNYVRFKTGEPLPELDAVSLIAKQIRKQIERMFDDTKR